MTKPYVAKHCLIGVVVIGRNEGERLKRCLSSVQSQHSGPIVYVDSGSTDGSADYARSVGVDVVDLDLSVPFTMARGRNTGLDHLVDGYSNCQFVQFVDGDCEMSAGWMDVGLQFLQDHQDYGGVCGNRSERSPNATLYNRLIAMEWQGSEGEVDACGGDAIYRIGMFQAAGCFNENMIAGEEADLCLRMRQLGYRLRRVDSPMTLHDANMQHFSQWWLRSVRCGHAYAHGYDLHRHDADAAINAGGYNRKPMLSGLLYGLVMPGLLVIILSILVASTSGLKPLLLFATAIVVLAAYGRIGRKASESKAAQFNSTRQRLVYAAFIVMAKLPEALGVLRYYFNRTVGKTSKIIEYKENNRAKESARSLKD